MKRLSLTIAVALLCGCASDITVMSDKGDVLPGFPIHSPILAQITTRTTFKVRDGKDHEKYKDLCPLQTVDKATTEVLPLGRVRYVDFEPAALGKSEFALEFTDNGVVKKVTINSDATAGVDSVTGFLEKVLPFYKEPASAGTATTMGALGAALDGMSEEERKKHCVIAKTEVIGADEIEVKLLDK